MNDKEKYYVVRLWIYNGGRYYNLKHRYRFRSLERAEEELKRCQEVIRSYNNTDYQCTLSAYKLKKGDEIMDDDKEIGWSFRGRR